MSKKMFDDVLESEREAMLEANCLRPEEKSVKKFFEPEEITEMRKQYMDNSIVIRKATEKLNKAKEEHKDSIKEPEKTNVYLLQSIRTGFVEVDQQVYLFDDQENGMMNYFDNKGELVESRRLTPEERQTRIK